MAAPALHPIDRLSAVLGHFPVQAQWLLSGPLCAGAQVTARPEQGFLQLLRHGQLTLTQGQARRAVQRRELHTPTLLLYLPAPGPSWRSLPSADADITCATLHFVAGANHPLVRALPPLLAIPLQAVPGLDGALALLFAEAEQLRCGHRLLADRLCEVVLIQLLRWLLDHPEQGGVSVGLVAGLADAALARALTAVHAQPGADWDVRRMAQQAGLSRSAFAARFKRLVGLSPADYLRDWRMRLAMQQLAQGQSVKCIADALGYANPSALSRVFAQRLGMPPRAWLATAHSARA